MIFTWLSTAPSPAPARRFTESAALAADGRRRHLDTIGVLLDGPLAGRYAYRRSATRPTAAGDWVLVPWGKARRVGLVIDDGIASLDTRLDPERIRPIEDDSPGLPPVDAGWLGLMRFAADYYHGPLAELALGTVPKLLRQPPSKRTRKQAADRLAEFDLADPSRSSPAAAPSRSEAAGPTDAAVQLTPAQQSILDRLREPGDDHRPWLLHGVTGSGKTEVYLHWFEGILADDPGHQVLMLVPEIGLTPALESQFRQRFPSQAIAVLHSDMPDATRASHWLAAATGRARVVIGTRLAALAPMPGLAAIAVDEEHDPSYKQQEGIRYSARDLAVARASRLGCPILLGSATPSLESWQHAKTGRYRRLSLTERARGGGLPLVQIVPLRGARLEHGLTPTARTAIRETLARGEQALVFLNRRGYAPVLSCQACGWLSDCDHCDAWRVLHRDESRNRPGQPARYRLICHHCATERPVPTACPTCGNQDLEPLGRGTQRLEEGLTSLFPEARIGRLDRDVARRRGATERFLAAVHDGDTNLLVGTQMLAKGHDFQRLNLVVSVDADAGLFAADFRAPERLFATLMQVAGRGGRHAVERARMLVQTRFPEHPMFARLVAHDYPRFADDELAAREQSGLPPFAYQALILAQGRTMDPVLAFLEEVSKHLLSHESAPDLTVCDPIPMPLAQLRNQSRGQMLLESSRRRPLHQALASLPEALDALVARIRSGLRWQIVVDPSEI